MQDGVVQNYYAGTREGALVDGAVQRVVTEMVEVNVGFRGVHLYIHLPPESFEQGSGIVRHPGPRRCQRREESDFHGFFRGPNSAVPTRTWVAPSSTATSRSCDIPMERHRKPWRTASSRRRRK